MLLKSTPDEAVGARIVVPQGQDSELAVPKPTTSSVDVLPPAPPPAPPASTPPPSTTTRPPAPPPATNRTPLKSDGVDFQAENAKINDGTVESRHAGFTGSGYVDYDTVSGSSVEWSVTAVESTRVDVIFRYANGSNESRPMTNTVNGIQVASASFGQTAGFEDWSTVTISVNLLAGTSRIKATATTGKGGPNVDKITLI
jgi:hypothetical protein